MRRSDKLLLIAKGLHGAQCAEADRDQARHKLPPVVRWANPWHPSGCGIKQQQALLRDAEFILASLESGRWYRRLACAWKRGVNALGIAVGLGAGLTLLALALTPAPAVACPEGQGDYRTDAEQGLCEDLEQMDQYRHYDSDDQHYQHRKKEKKK